MTLKPAHSRAARALLDQSQQDLADAAGVSLSSVKRFESGDVDTRPALVVAIERALKEAGILLLDDSVFESKAVSIGVALTQRKRGKRR
jgi:predicted transcriptional regulator